jgi:hypothetical protein
LPTGAQRAAPQRRDRQRGALREPGKTVAVVRRLAREGHDAAGAQHAPELAERALEIRDVVQHGVPEDDVERVVLERQVLGLADDGVDRRQSEPLGRSLEGLEHPPGHVRGDDLVEPALAEQVEGEVPGARADLEPAAVRFPAVAAERLLHLAQHLSGALGPVVDAPLGVVRVRRQVVVAHVGFEDFVRGLLRHGDGGGL